MRAAGHEGDGVAGFGQPAAELPADAARTEDRDPHQAMACRLPSIISDPPSPYDPRVARGSGLPLLGGLTAAAFLRRHWQKRPLFVRGAIPAFVPPVTPAALLALAARPD